MIIKMRFGYFFIPVFLIFFFSCLCNLYAQQDLNPVEKYGRLSFKEGRLRDTHDNIIVLRGMSLFWSQWQPQFYNEDTVKNLRDFWKVNVVRVAMGIEHGGYLENPIEEKKKVFNVIEAAIKYGIYVIVDWHDHHAEDHLQQSKEFFKELSAKYGQVPNLIYEIYNEPLNVSWTEVLLPYHQQIITTIRKNDSENLIICGTPNWSQGVLEASRNPLEGFNLAYTLHFYAGTHSAKLRDQVSEALKTGMPIFVTEFGTTHADGDGQVFYKESNIWLDFMTKNQVSWCNWSISNKAEASSALLPQSDSSDLNNPRYFSESGYFIYNRLTH
mgnify:FL=1